MFEEFSESGIIKCGEVLQTVMSNRDVVTLRCVVVVLGV